MVAGQLGILLIIINLEFRLTLQLALKLSGGNHTLLGPAEMVQPCGD